MTNHNSKFRVGNIVYSCYFVVGTHLSNLCQSFISSLGTFS